MANKKPKKTTARSAKHKAEEANVTRIRATDAKPTAPKKKKAAAAKNEEKHVVKAVDDKSSKKVTKAAVAEVKPATVKAQPVKKKRRGTSAKKSLIIFTPFTAFGRYVKGAWLELRQVRWPTRRATWSMTFAVIVYSVFFIVIVLILDAAFKYLFELLIK